MKKIRKLDYSVFIKYLIFLVIFFTFSKLDKSTPVFAVAPFAVAVYLGFNLFVLAPLLLLSAFVTTGSGYIASLVISIVVIAIIKFVYAGFNKTPKYETVGIVALSLLGYVILGNTLTETDILLRVTISLLTCAFSLIFFVASSGALNKGLRKKLRYEERLCIIVCICLFGLGFSNLLSPAVWKAISIFIVLCCAYFFRLGTTTVISCALGVGVCIYYGNISYAVIYLFFGIIADALTPVSRYLAAIFILPVEYACFTVFGVYGAFTLTDFLFTLVGTLCFSLIPSKPLNALKDRFNALNGKQLSRVAINRNRVTLSNRLYELSFVFSEIANAFEIFKESAPSPAQTTALILSCVKSEICDDCVHKERCEKNEVFKSGAFNKLISVGIAKNKLSFIDLPTEITKNCTKVNDIIFAVNKKISELQSVERKNRTVQSGRDLIASQSVGVSQMLKSLALETGAQLKFLSKTEKDVGDALLRRGIQFSELMVFSPSAENAQSVSLITSAKQIPESEIARVISKVLGVNMQLSVIAGVTEDKTFLSFVRAPIFDAVFGVASAVKFGSDLSGDTHSAVRIPNDKLLVALSDGMGSGQNAEKISSASLTLIECFYKAGLSSDLILNTVNRLLSINTDDQFTALDISVIDLNSRRIDFIKYGAPCCYIVGRDGIKIVEGSSLPLGILEELKPAVATSSLNDGDLLVLITDGVSDAFGSSTELIEFLRTLPAKNPQSLCDSVIKKALSLNGGKANDDMTCASVRLFKKDA